MKKNDLPAGAKRFLPEGRELRTVRHQPVEARADADGEMVIEGHGAVFNEWANIGGWFLERVAPGAFKVAVKENDVRLLKNHNPDNILARTANGTLHLEEDKTGLLYRGDLNPLDPYAVSAFEQIKRGDISQSSFAFRVLEEHWEAADDDTDGDLPKRTILKAELFDVAPVTYPAYEGTDVGARAAAIAMQGELSTIIGLSDAARDGLFEAMAAETREDTVEKLEAYLVELRTAPAEGPAEEEKIIEPVAEEAPDEEETPPAAAEDVESDSLEDDGEPPAEEAAGDNEPRAMGSIQAKLRMMELRRKFNS